jgi:hypothetical protein
MVLYSLTADECDVSGDFGIGTIYTMTSITESMQISAAAASGTTIHAQIGLINSTNNQPPAGANGNGPAPTTAVAMSILYSITGIITLLFLVIIATGAIRAHRHPERYGPRTGHLGRPRQSRAKGLARAMLETLPIVKFGDPEPAKPENRDIELEDGTRSVHTPETIAAAEATGANNEKTSNSAPEAAALQSGMNENTQGTSIHEGEAPAVVRDGELGCSICTEDFTTGEDVRVLPCKHKYHPACIDPWLLNVSGTCPLW